MRPTGLRQQSACPFTAQRSPESATAVAPEAVQRPVVGRVHSPERGSADAGQANPGSASTLRPRASATRSPATASTPPDNVLLIHAREGEKLSSLGRLQVEGALSDLERLRHDVVSSVGPVSSDTNTARPSINRTR